jgi:lipoate-protein ligase A
MSMELAIIKLAEAIEKLAIAQSGRSLEVQTSLVDVVPEKIENVEEVKEKKTRAKKAEKVEEVKEALEPEADKDEAPAEVTQDEFFAEVVATIEAAKNIEVDIPTAVGKIRELMGYEKKLDVPATEYAEVIKRFKAYRGDK